MKKKVVKITWEDASSDSKTWVAPDELVGLSTIVTVGILIKKTKDYVCISHSMSEDGYMCGVFFIPRGCIKSTECLCEVKQ